MTCASLTMPSAFAWWSAVTAAAACSAAAPGPVLPSAAGPWLSGAGAGIFRPMLI